MKSRSTPLVGAISWLNGVAGMISGFLLPMELPHLEAALRDSDSASAEARWVAALALGGEQGPRRKEAIDALIRLARDPVEEVRVKALEALAEQARGDAEVPIGPVVDALGSESAAVRSKAVEVSASIMDEPIPVIVPLARDKEPWVRAAVASALGDLGARTEEELVAALLEDDDFDVRLEAAISLASFGDRRGEPILLDALDQERDRTFDIAIAIGLLGTKSAGMALDENIGKRFASPEIKGIAAAAAARCGIEDGKKDLSDMLCSRRRRNRIAALQAICALPVTGMTSAVGRLVGEGNEAEKSSAVRTLMAMAEVDPVEAKAELERWKERSALEIREEIEEALNSQTEGEVSQ